MKEHVKMKTKKGMDVYSLEKNEETGIKSDRGKDVMECVRVCVAGFFQR
jgi:hypothetical protein